MAWHEKLKAVLSKSTAATTKGGPARPILNPPLHCQWNTGTNRDLHTPYSRVLFFEWLSDSAKYSMTRSTRSLSVTLTVEVIVICQLVTQQWKTTINRHFSVNITTNPRSWDYRFFNPEFGDWKTDPGLQLQLQYSTVPIFSIYCSFGELGVV